MKILMINHNLQGRGTWHRAWQLGRSLAQRGHEVKIWTAAPHHWYRSSAQTRDGVRIVETPSWAPLAPADDGWGTLDIAWRKTAALFENFDLCYAFAHAPNVYAPAWVAKHLRRKPVVYDWCDWYEGGVFPKRNEMRRAGLAAPPEIFLHRQFEPIARRLEIFYERRMPRLAGRVTAISSLLAELTIKMGVAREDVFLLPNGANCETTRPLDAGPCRAELGLADGPEAAYLGYVANYHPDQAMFLEAFARAIAARPGLRMLMAGPPFDTGLVERLGLNRAIIEFGWCDQARVNTILGASGAMAMPMEDNDFNRSRMPFKFSDYLAAGRPVVTSPVGDLAQYFAPASPAIGLAAPPTPEDYGAALAGVFAPGIDRAAMGAAARQLAETRLDWPRLAERLEPFLEASL